METVLLELPSILLEPLEIALNEFCAKRTGNGCSSCLFDGLGIPGLPCGMPKVHQAIRDAKEKADES